MKPLERINYSIPVNQHRLSSEYNISRELSISLVAIFIDLTSDFVVQVQAAVDNLRASAAQRTSCLEKEMSTAHNSSSSVKEQWKTHMEETEAHYVEDIEGIETGKLGLDDGFRNW